MGGDDDDDERRRGFGLAAARRWWRQRGLRERVAFVGCCALLALLLLKLLIRDHDNLFVLAELAHFAGIGFLLYKMHHNNSCEGASPTGPRGRAAAGRVPQRPWAGGAGGRAERGTLERPLPPAPLTPSAAGISLKSQELTAAFLGIRLYCRRASRCRASQAPAHPPTPPPPRSFMMEYDVHTLLDALTLFATGWVLVQMRTRLSRSYSARKDSVRVDYIVRAPACAASDPFWVVRC